MTEKKELLNPHKSEKRIISTNIKRRKLIKLLIGFFKVIRNPINTGYIDYYLIYFQPFKHKVEFISNLLNIKKDK